MQWDYVREWSLYQCPSTFPVCVCVWEVKRQHNKHFFWFSWVARDIYSTLDLWRCLQSVKLAVSLRRLYLTSHSHIYLSVHPFSCQSCLNECHKCKLYVTNLNQKANLWSIQEGVKRQGNRAMQQNEHQNELQKLKTKTDEQKTQHARIHTKMAKSPKDMLWIFSSSAA